MSDVLRPHPLCGVFDDGTELYAARLPDGPILAFDELSALIWRSAADGSRADVVARVVEATGETPEAVRPHIDAFLDDLVSRGLLVVTPGV